MRIVVRSAGQNYYSDHLSDDDVEDERTIEEFMEQEIVPIMRQFPSMTNFHMVTDKMNRYFNPRHIEWIGIDRS